MAEKQQVKPHKGWPISERAKDMQDDRKRRDAAQALADYRASK